MSSSSARPSHTPRQTRADMKLTGVGSCLRCGKTPGARSLLHDDMTVIVIDFVDMSKMHLRAQALQMDMPPSPPPTNSIPKPVIQADLLRATEQMMALPTPPAQRMGTKVRPPPPQPATFSHRFSAASSVPLGWWRQVSNKRRGSVMLSLNAPDEKDPSARIPKMALDGGEGQGKGKTRGQAKGIKAKRRGSATGAISEATAAAAAAAAAAQ